MADGAADHAAQHVAAPFIAWSDAIDDQEGTGADVVGDDLERVVAKILRAGFPSGGLDQGLEQVDFVVGMHALHHRRDALQSHPGIHRRPGQGVHDARFIAVVLHEDQVPDFDVAVAVFLGCARRAARDFCAVVVEDLGTGAAGAGVAHRPEVVGVVTLSALVADAGDARLRDADFLGPDGVGLVVILVDRDPEFFPGDRERLGQKLPGEADRVLFEIIAEAEVAQHLEKSVVPGRITDIFQVVVLAAGAHAALA